MVVVVVTEVTPHAARSINAKYLTPSKIVRCRTISN
jgi:hypothetical protein